ncbi:MAG: hypothetical protein ACR2KJ_02805 [Jatrophihabitans sp.]
MEANLPPLSGLVAPAALAEQLGAAGFTHVVSDRRTAGLDWTTIEFVIAVDGPQRPAAVAGQITRHGATVAEFGAGAARMSVVELLDGTDSPASRVKMDAAVRKMAGAQLLGNPAVHPDAAARALIAGGRLDMRAATILATLAQDGEVAVGGLVQDAAERRAGLPIRTLTITVDDLDRANRAVSSAMSLYHPSSTQPTGANSERLTWSPAVAPVITTG